MTQSVLFVCQDKAFKYMCIFGMQKKNIFVILFLGVSIYHFKQ